MTIDEYIEQEEEALRRWYDIHTDAETWADNWIMDYDTVAQFIADCGSRLKNDYFDVDIVEEA